MKFLLFSDIHHNLAAVQKMRAQESNEYDALVVAGDIGSDSAQQIFDVLTTFECPVLYVYGNWDNKLGYDATFGRDCHHLHLTPFHSGPITFVGFSGCTTNWGQNPEAQRLLREADDTHSEMVRALADAKNEDDSATALIQAEYDTLIENLRTDPTSRRPVSQRKLKTLNSERQQRLNAFPKAIEKVEKTVAHRAYRRQLMSVSEEALVRNRYALSQALTRLETPRERLVVVTHDRLSKTQIDFPGVPVFLFGHRHGFAETKFQSATYINVSALDLRRLLRPKVFSRANHWEQFRNLNVGNYAVLEWDERAGFNVRCVKLDVDLNWQENWELETFIQMPRAPLLS